MKCPKCREEIPEKSVECPECGVIIAKAKPRGSRPKASAPKPPPPPPPRSISGRNPKMKQCPDCGHEVSKSAKSCPNCGAVIKNKSGSIGCLSVLIISFCFLWVYNNISNVMSPKKSSPQVEAKKRWSDMTPSKKEAVKKERERVRAEEYEKCKLTLECWGNKHDGHAILKAEPLIEKMAKYQAKWIDGVFEPKISKFKWLDKDDLTVTYIGDKVQFQNGFSAWQNMIYHIDYDPINDRVLDIRLIPGRL